MNRSQKRLNNAETGSNRFQTVVGWQVGLFYATLPPIETEAEVAARESTGGVESVGCGEWPGDSVYSIKDDSRRRVNEESVV